MKRAAVLGATAGIGKAISKRLTSKGYFVTGFHRGRQLLAFERDHFDGHAERLIKQDAGRDPKSVVKAMREITEPVDVLVHSLSGASVGNILHQTPNQAEQTFNCLAHSFLWWVQGLYVTGMLAPGARIIALSNPCPDFYLRNSGVIGSAKAALESYVKSLAAELGPEGYRVNCIRFSTVLTPALAKVMPEAGLMHMHKLHKSIVPAGRMQTADDVAKFVSLMVREESAWMNGAIVDLTGGAPSMLMDYAFYGMREDRG